MKPAVVAGFLAVALVGLQAQGRRPRYDVVIRHGAILDGTGGVRYQGDVAVANGFIVRIGNLEAARGTVEIDAGNLVVAPGFINIHSHASPDALARAENMLTQGVTTEIVNPDGGGSTDIAQQLADAARSGLALNVGAYIGFNSVWTKVVGPADRRPTPADIADMQRLVTDGLEHGAWGVSSGLDYKPAYYAKTDEVVAVLKPAAKWRTNFPNHDRLTPESNFSSRAGVAETIEIGEKAGLVPVVTHMKAQGIEQGTAAMLVGMMREATERGHYTAADVYPYLAGQSGLGALIIPAWAQDGGREKMLERFKDPVQRARIVAESEQAMTARFGGPQGVYLPATGRELTDAMHEMNVSGGEAVVRLLEEGNAGAILRFGSEPDLVKLLQYPATAVACDCGATTETRTHPRMYGTFPRVLGHYVRETHALSWEDAIRKMTALPANIVGMVDRGYLEAGMAADITIFDPRTVIDHATYENPAQLSEGIRYVLVNGKVAVRAGKVTGEQGGRILARSVHMQSRAMTSRTAHHLTLDTTANGLHFAVAVTQTERARRAAGTFRVLDGDGKVVLEATALGVLQAAPHWATFTGRARGRDTSAEQAFTAIVEEADPSADGRPSIVVYVDGAPLAVK